MAFQAECRFGVRGFICERAQHCSRGPRHKRKVRRLYTVRASCFSASSSVSLVVAGVERPTENHEPFFSLSRPVLSRSTLFPYILCYYCLLTSSCACVLRLLLPADPPISTTCASKCSCVSVFCVSRRARVPPGSSRRSHCRAPHLSQRLRRQRRLNCQERARICVFYLFIIASGRLRLFQSRRAQESVASDRLFRIASSFLSISCSVPVTRSLTIEQTRRLDWNSVHPAE